MIPKLQSLPLTSTGNTYHTVIVTITCSVKKMGSTHKLIAFLTVWIKIFIYELGSIGSHTKVRVTHGNLNYYIRA